MAKEKPVVSSDGVSDLFAQMSLKGSSPLDPLVSSGKDLQTITDGESDADSCSTPTLPAASNHTTSCHEIPSVSSSCLPEALASPCHMGTLSEAQSSLSVSGAIAELQLSNIDWDALSFNAAPSPQSRHSKADHQPASKSDKGSRTESCGSSAEAPSEDCVEVEARRDDRCPLMERLHLRKCSGSSEEKDSKHQSVGSELKYTSGSGHKPLSENPKVPPHSHYLKAALKEKAFKKPPQSKHAIPASGPPKYKFVKLKHSNRTSSDPEQTKKESVCKKSVCKGQGLSSDDSDVENQLLTKQQSKLKAIVKPKSQAVQKPVLEQQLLKQSRCNQVPVSVESESTTPTKQPHNSDFTRTKSVTQTKSDDDDDDDSDASISSPLPLAERLKLKLNK